MLEERGLELREYDRKEVGKFNPKRLTRREVLQKQTEEADLRFMPAPTFYSKAERAVEGAKGGVFDKKGMTTTDKAISLFDKREVSLAISNGKSPEAEVRVEWRSGLAGRPEGRGRRDVWAFSVKKHSNEVERTNVRKKQRGKTFSKEEVSSGKIISTALRAKSQRLSYWS